MAHRDGSIVQRHRDPDAFLAVAAPLARHSAPLYAFLHAWVESVRCSTPGGRAYMATARDGFALQRDDGPVFIDARSDRAAAALADDLFTDNRDVDAVTGSEPACIAFCARWSALTGRVGKLRMRTRSHVLTALSPPRGVAVGRMRAATERDAPWLAARMREFADEAGLRIGAATLERLIAERLGDGSWRLWCVDDLPVAFAGTTRAGPEASRIGPVYTLPPHRNRGHGSALVAAACAELLQQRPQVFLTTDASNATSNELYRRLGFRPVDEGAVYDLVDRR